MAVEWGLMQIYHAGRLVISNLLRKVETGNTLIMTTFVLTGRIRGWRQTSSHRQFPVPDVFRDMMEEL